MKGWKTYKFSEAVDISPKVTLERGQDYPFVEMAELNSERKFCEAAEQRPFDGGGTRFENGDTLFARITPCLENGKICQVRNLSAGKGFGSTEFHVLRGKEGVTDTNFVYYLSRWDEVRDFAEANLHGTSGRQRVPREAFDTLEVNLPPLPEQRAIADVLSSLDDKIDLLSCQNKTIERLCSVLWKGRFVESPGKGWQEDSLDKIAVFLNGLPCQKYPPKGASPTLPVIKIKELRTGITADSDAAIADVPSEYIVEEGDILFSWSGSLDVAIWGHEKGILNQHLFKVTSSAYPKWFYYLWIKHHLPDFQDIAQDKATTMGHIQRHHLSDAKVLIPDRNTFAELNSLFAPLFNKIVQNLKEIRTLESMRDVLMPKLLSGEQALMGSKNG